MDVPEPHVVQRLELVPDVRDRLEELERLRDGHLEDLGDGAALVVDLERFAVVASALADLARDVDVRQELHLDLDDPVALAVLAAPALDVEREPTRRVAADARFGNGGKELPDGAEQPRVRRRVRSRRPANRRLVDLDDLVDVLDALERVVGADLLTRLVQLARQGVVQDVGHERALATARDAGHGGEGPERELDVEIAEVVRAGVANDELLAVALPPLRRNRDRPLAAKERASDRAG